MTFVDEDGETVLDTQSVAEGEAPVYDGETPTKAATAQYTYAFAGWDKEFAEVTENATYTATYDRTVNQYTVTYTGTGVETQTSTVNYGAGTPTYRTLQLQHPWVSS